MKSNVFTVGAALIMLSGCGNQTEKTELKPVKTPSSETEILKTEPKLPATFFEKLLAGETLNIILDVCDPSDRDSWLGATDPAGGIICGETYEISYAESTNRIMARGLLENREGGEHTIRYNGREWTGANNRFNIWGSRHYMNASGEVFDKNNDLIGHIIQ